MLVRRFDLTADLAARRQVRMHVSVGGAGPDSADDFGKITSRELLACSAPSYDV
jgi:hypothetical protein